jgi:CheY-like chemotaxis protein
MNAIPNYRLGDVFLSVPVEHFRPIAEENAGSVISIVGNGDDPVRTRRRRSPRRPNVILPPIVFAGPDSGVLTEYAAHFVQNGFDARLVHSGLDCIDLIRRVTPCVLVLDLDPGLIWGSADDVLALLCDDSDVPPVPVIILTSSPKLQSQKRWPAKLRAVVTKPIDTAVLTHVVETWWKPPWCDREHGANGQASFAN